MMTKTDQSFTVIFCGKPLDIDVYRQGRAVLYLALFKDRGKLFITKAKDFEGGTFWTSIPEGQLDLAEEIGALIEAQEPTANNDNQPKQKTLF